MLKPITSSETIEIPITDLNTSRYYLPENFNLRDFKIKYLLTQYTYLGSKTPQNRYLVGNSHPQAIDSSYLTLTSNNNKQEINKLPLTHLLIHEFWSSGNVYTKLLELDRKIKLTESFIDISELYWFNTDESYLLTALYNELKKPSETIDLRGLHVETVEIPITQNGPLKYYFPDNERLRHKKIVKIEQLGDDNNVITPLGYNQQTFYYITLNISGKERINNLPSFLLNRQVCQKNQIIFDNVKVDFTQSYITLPTAQTNAKYAACLQFYYKD